MNDPYVHPVPVRYLEVDQQGVVYNMWYLAYIDDAMTGFFEHYDCNYVEMTNQGVDCQLVHVSLDWQGSARFGDLVQIAARAERLGTTSLTLAYTLRVAGTPIATATVTYVFIATDGSGKVPIPTRLRSALERGSPPE